MRYGTESGARIFTEIDIELAGAPLRGMEPLEELSRPERMFGGLQLGDGPLTGPELDPCDEPPSEEELRGFLPMESDEELRGNEIRLFGASELAVLTVDAYGAPSYGPLGRPEGFAFHTPENVDHTLAQAIAIARWQASTGNTSGGSYMGILGYNGTAPMSDPLAWTMARSVPWNVAAGGISTNRDPSVWGPNRYPWMAEMLSPAAYGDPNRYLQQIAISGKATWWRSKLSTAGGRDEVRGALIALARWIRTLELAYSYDAVLTLHRFWQLNRTDPADVNFADLVLDEYVKLIPAPSPAPEPEPTPAPVGPSEREKRLATEAVELRKLMPSQMAAWHSATGMQPDYAGPLHREMRLAAEVLYGRRMKALLPT